MTKELELQYQAYRFHTLRWMMQTLNELEGILDEGWQAPIDEVRRIIRTLPNDGPRLLHLLLKRVVPPSGPRAPEAEAVPRLRLLILKVAENWYQYVLFLADQGVPTTNNATERAIGHWRTRSKTTHSF